MLPLRQCLHILQHRQAVARICSSPHFVSLPPTIACNPQHRQLYNATPNLMRMMHCQYIIHNHIMTHASRPENRSESFALGSTEEGPRSPDASFPMPRPVALRESHHHHPCPFSLADPHPGKTGVVISGHFISISFQSRHFVTDVKLILESAISIFHLTKDGTHRAAGWGQTTRPRREMKDSRLADARHFSGGSLVGIAVIGHRDARNP